MSALTQQAYQRYFGLGEWCEKDRDRDLLETDTETQTESIDADPLLVGIYRSGSLEKLKQATGKSEGDIGLAHIEPSRFGNVLLCFAENEWATFVESRSAWRPAWYGTLSAIPELKISVRDAAASAAKVARADFRKQERQDTSISEIKFTAKEQPNELQQLFLSLSQEWREATKFSSSTSEIVMHEAYQRIIGLGPMVIPLILQDLRKNSGYWFWALRALTRENPVPKDDVGRIKKMTEAWLDWGKKNYLI